MEDDCPDEEMDLASSSTPRGKASHRSKCESVNPSEVPTSGVEQSVITNTFTSISSTTIMAVSISSLRVEHYRNPLGISEVAPRLQWRFTGAAEGWKQKSYDVEVTRDGKSKTFHGDSVDNVLVPWPSSPLRSRDRADITVTANGSDGGFAKASTTVEAGLLDEGDWKAKMVGSGETDDKDLPKRPIRFRCRFNAPKGRGRLYITARGVYESKINGKLVGDELLAPGWTDYDNLLRYAVHDISDLLVEGDNYISVWVAECWFAGRYGPTFIEERNIWGDALGLLAQVEVDGKVVSATDNSWQWSYGAIVGAELYNGEIYDSNIDDELWHVAKDRDKWHGVKAQEFKLSTLTTSQSPPVRTFATLPAKEITTSSSGKTLIDFGQNFAGWVEFKSEPPKSGTLVLRHAEVLEHGELGVRPLRSATQTNTIRLGGKLKGWHPRFTFQGFRYLEITGWPGVKLDDLIGVAISTDMERTGNFSCSHELINQLYSNVYWSSRANTISVPTDCPQRSERLGWTGDAQLFPPTMGYMFDAAGFLGDWLKDLWTEQQKLPNKQVPLVIPNVFLPHFDPRFIRPQALWGDACVIIPWNLWTIYADKDILAHQFASIKAWLSTGIKRDPQTNMWAEDHPQFADWLSPAAPPGAPAMGPTDNRLVANAYLVHATRTAARIAEVLGHQAQAKQYLADADKLLHTFHELYITRRGRVMSDTQTALALIIIFDLFDPSVLDQREAIYARLVRLVRRNFWLVSTGLAGTPIILQALTQAGALSDAYRMLQAKDTPSWLAPILLGATSIWERWDSMLQDGTINPGRMTSFNHYALGAVAAFLQNVIGGLSPLEPGWRKALIKPQPGGSITSAKTNFNSPYGEYHCEWEIGGGKLEVAVGVPPNASARVELPGQKAMEIGSGLKRFSVKYEAGEWPPPEIESDWILQMEERSWI